MFKKLRNLFVEGKAKPLDVRLKEFPPGDVAEAARLTAEGNRLLDDGKPGQAANCYRRATQLNPDDAGAFINLGFALIEQGLHLEAEGPLRQAVQLDSSSVDAHYLLGTTLEQRGASGEAIDALSRALRLRPDFALCRRDLSRLMFEAGDIEGAKQILLAGIARSPQLAEFHGYLGNLLRSQGDAAGAVSSLRTALVIQPNFVDALVALGSSLHSLGDLSSAAEAFESALFLTPENATAHCSLAGTLLAQGKRDVAVQHYRTALRISPRFAEAHCDLATALQQSGDLEAAIRHYREAVSIKPKFADALSNLGTTLQATGRVPEAIDALQRALAVDANHAAAHNNLGNAFHEVGRLDDAVACFRNALRLDPEYVDALGNLGGVLQAQCHIDAAIKCYESALALKPDFADAQSNLLFTVNYHPDMSAGAIFEHYSAFERRLVAHSPIPPATYKNSRDFARRLKVGYVSPDLRQHSVRYFLEPLLAHHDHEGFEVFAYAELTKADAMTARYQTYVDHWVPTLGMTHQTLAERIRADEIDVLVDLAGHTANNRLGAFRYKPAPVSVSWLGFGYTTGLTAIDYLLTDETCAPVGSEALFAERPWRLPAPGLAYRPAANMGPVGCSPAQERGFVTFGTLTRAVRINHHTVRVWSEILKRVSRSRLVIDSNSYQDATMRTELQQRFAEHGVTADRLEIGCHSPPWDVLRGVDIGLDCFPHNSGTTLFETLYMGLPYITLAGRPSVGLLGSSILLGIGFPEWVASTEAGYIQAAVALSEDLPRLASLRSELRAHLQASPLMNEPAFARKVEAAYREMFTIWAKQNPQNGSLLNQRTRSR